MRAMYNTLWASQSSPGGGPISWGPTINLLRDPRWGRVQESVSECPYLTGEYGIAVSSGLQRGSDARYLLSAATLKHLSSYSLEQYGPESDPAEWERQTFNAVVTPFDLTDSYLPAFKAAITAGGAAGIMYAANELNGVPCAASVQLDDLLHSWQFDGYRCTDGGKGHVFSPLVCVSCDSYLP